MTFDINMQIDNQSPEGHALELVVYRDRISPEEAIRRMLAQFGSSTADNCDYLFTPETVSDLRRIATEIEEGGKTYSIDEVDEHFIQKRKAWLAKHPS